MMPSGQDRRRASDGRERRGERDDDSARQPCTEPFDERAIGSDARHAPPDADPGRARARDTLLQRLFWFGALWVAGVVAVSIVSYAIRAMVMP